MIKNIIFDLGGVIINLDMERTFEAFRQLAGTADIPMYTYTRQHEIFKQLEIGAISPEDFVAELQRIFGNGVSSRQIQDAWNAMLLDIPPARLQLLKDLKAKYRTYLFSNTNVLHYNAFNAYLLKEFQSLTLEPYFHKTYYSHLMGKRKPDEAAFQQILDENGLKAEETLFLDDTPGHLEGAARAGIQTHLVTAEDTIMDILKDF
jgi:HAD superfamily hydrolase (TIGR01509 family)